MLILSHLSRGEWLVEGIKVQRAQGIKVRRGQHIQSDAVVGSLAETHIAPTRKPRLASCHVGMGQNPIPLVNIKIAGKWMFIPLKMVLIGIDPYPCFK